MHQRSYAGCAFIQDVYKINTGCAKWPAEYFLAAKNKIMLSIFMQSLFIITWYFWFPFPFHCILCNTYVMCVIRTIRQIFCIYFLQFHILLILADGQMEEAEATLSALVDASQYPLSIVMVGVGDGPWGLMEDCDDLLPARKFDNFQVAISLKPVYAFYINISKIANSVNFLCKTSFFLVRQLPRNIANTEWPRRIIRTSGLNGST